MSYPLPDPSTFAELLENITRRHNQSYVSVTDFNGGGVGYDIQAAIDAAATAGNPGTAFFPDGRSYETPETIDWHRGVSLVGGQSSNPVRTRLPEIKWTGAAGGTLFRVPANGSNIHQQPARYLCFRGTGTNNPNTLIEFEGNGSNDEVDFGTLIEHCQFSNCDGDAIKINGGVTNFHIADCRWDVVRGYAIYIDANKTRFTFSIDRFTYDNGAGGSKGFLHLDGLNALADTGAFGNISNARVEINSPLTEAQALFYLSINPAMPGNAIQFRLKFDTIDLHTNSGTNQLDFIGHSSPTDKVDVTLLNCNTPLHTSRKIIANTVTPPPEPQRNYPLMIFAPFGNGITQNQQNRVVMQAETQIRALALGSSWMTVPVGTLGLQHIAAASVPTPAAGQAILFIDTADGGLKIRTSTGALRTVCWS